MLSGKSDQKLFIDGRLFVSVRVFSSIQLVRYVNYAIIIMKSFCRIIITDNNTSWWRSTVVRTSVCDRRTFPDLHHDVQLTGDLLGVNRPLYVSQLIHSFSLG